MGEHGIALLVFIGTHDNWTAERVCPPATRSVYFRLLVVTPAAYVSSRSEVGRAVCTQPLPSGLSSSDRAASAFERRPQSPW